MAIRAPGESSMHKEGDEIHETTTEARAGIDIKGMTTVLAAGLIIVIGAFVAIWLYWF
jgi:hypothetical protein